MTEFERELLKVLGRIANALERGQPPRQNPPPRPRPSAPAPRPRPLGPSPKDPYRGSDGMTHSLPQPQTWIE